MRKPIELLGVKVDRVDTWEALSRIGSLMAGSTAAHVVTVNPEYVMLAQKNPELKTTINDSDLSVPDGMGIVWSSRLLGEPLRGRVTGTGLLPEICRLSARRGDSVFFLGGSPGVAEKAAAELRRRFPELEVAGTSSLDPEPELDRTALDLINSSGARVLAVAYGCPKQDLWISRNLAGLSHVRVAIGVGGAFDFISGEVPRAPRWMRRFGLEWLYRLLRQPSRVRRMLALPRFVLAVRRERRARV